MRRKKIGLALLASAMVAGSASAAPVSMANFFGHSTGADSLANNWGVANTASLFNTVDSAGAWASTSGTYWQGDGPLYANASGGQDFDIEAMYSGFDASTSTLYVTMVTGFNLRGEYVPTPNNVNPDYYFVGDLFIDFGRNPSDLSNPLPPTNAPPWDLGFRISTFSSEYPTSTSWSSPGTYSAGNALTTSMNGDTNIGVGAPVSLNAYTGGSGVSTIGTLPSNQGFPVNSPFRINTATSTSAGNFSFQYLRGGIDTQVQNSPSGTDHNVYNFAYTITNQQWLDLLYVGDDGHRGYSLHWTMSCGNDVVNLNVPGMTSTVPGDPDGVVPVPAAAPLGLVGMIAIGLFRKVRSKKS